MEKKEKEKRIRSAYITMIIHGVLFLIFFFSLAWTEPDPPIPEYGIEFSLGNATIPQQVNEEESASTETEQVEEVQEEEVVEETSEPAESDPSDAEESPEPVEESPIEEGVESIDESSPDVVKESSPEPKEQVSEEKVVEQGTGKDTQPKSEETKKEPEKEAKTETPKIDSRAIYKKNTGDKSGGNKGASLDMRGWMWDFKPRPDDQSNENGKIVFEIVVDDEGEIIRVKTLDKNVSPALEKLYRDAVMELTFSPTSDNRNVASQSTGKITFIIQSK